MPWQQHVVDVAFEMDPDTGRLVYREIGLTVPRQSGKTTLILAKNVFRVLNAAQFGGRQISVYTAQTRNKAREKLLDDFVPELRACKRLDGRWRARRALGGEAIIWDDGSRWAVEATTDKAGHGSTVDNADVDEAFAQTNDSVEQALRPAMVTRPAPQLWVLSTAGTERSTYFKGKVDKGRKVVESGADTDHAYFEWSLDPDADQENPENWWRCMPAVGHTVRREAIHSEAKGDWSVFQRAYLNLWVASDPVVQVIPEDVWAGCFDASSEIVGDFVVVLDVARGGGSAAVAVAGRRADGRVHAEVVEHRPGTDWCAGVLADLQERWDPMAVALDPSTAGDLVADVRAAGVQVRLLKSADRIAGKARLERLCRSGDFRHIGQVQLDAALAGARSSDVGDATVWGRRSSTGVDICPLVAVSGATQLFAEVEELSDPGVAYA